MALVDLDIDPWLSEHDSCERLYREIMEQLTLRNKEPRTSQNYAQLSSTIRLRMNQYRSEVQQLDEKLRQLQISNSITIQEAERRGRQIEVLQSKARHLQQALLDRGLGPEMHNRSQLMTGSGYNDGATVSWKDDDDDEEPLSVEVIRQQQKMMLEEQDEGLEALSQVIGRQKQIANTIGNEVSLHNEILDDLTDNMDRTDARLLSETNNVRTVSAKSSLLWYWVVIILLLIAIISVAVA